MANRPSEGVGRPAPGSLDEQSSTAARIAVPRARVRGDDHRGHQQPRRCPAGDRLPALCVESRHPQGAPRHVDCRRQSAARRPGTPGLAALFDEPDPVELLAGFAGVTTAIDVRTSDVYRVPVNAADSDPAAAKVLTEIQQQRRRGQRQIAAALARSGSLRQGLHERDAIDLIHAPCLPRCTDSSSPTRAGHPRSTTAAREHARRAAHVTRPLSRRRCRTRCRPGR